MTRSVTPTSTEPHLRPLRLVGFAALCAPLAAAGAPLAVFLPAFYAKDLGLSLGVVGLIMLMGRIWDAITDPVIAVLSDNTSSRFGRRRPWIVTGSILFAVAAVPLFFPPPSFNAFELGLALFLFYLGWTMMQIPFSAWSGELSGNYHQRTRIVSYQQVVTVAAMLVLLIAPTVIDQFQPQNDRLKAAIMGLIVLVSLVPGVALTLASQSEPARPFGTGVKGSVPPSALVNDFFQGLSKVFSSPLMLRVLVSDFAVVTGQIIRSVLIVFFVTFYMGRPEWASGLFLFQFVFGIFAGPIWLFVGARLGKHRTAIVAELLQCGINLALLLVTPGHLPLLLGLTVAQGLSQSSGNIMLRAMVADVADQHRLRTGIDRTALHFSVFSLSTKLAGAFAIGLAFPLVSALGFDPKQTNTNEALEGLKLVFALGPAFAHLLSAVVLKGFSLSAVEHADIRRQLDDRENAPVPAPAK